MNEHSTNRGPGTVPTASRDAFLRTVREAARACGRPGLAAPLDPSLPVRAQRSIEALVEQFTTQARAAGAQVYPCRTAEGAKETLVEIAKQCSARTILLGVGLLLERLGIRTLGGPERTIVSVSELSPERARAEFFGADLGVSEAHCLIAETGSIVLQAGAGEPRSVSLLPPVHVVIAEAHRVVDDLFDLFTPACLGAPDELSSCVTLITGPSKTGDIELRLVTGVHGPGAVHVIIVAE